MLHGLARRFCFPAFRHQSCKIHPPLSIDHDIDPGFVQAERFEHQSPSEKTVRFEIDEALLETGNECTVRFMEPNVVDLKTEQEWVNLHRSHAKFTMQLFRYHAGHKAGYQVRG